MEESKTVVVGLDGAHWELLDDWLAAGELPTIKRIIENGVSSDLRSVLPPVTSPNWKAYTTGKNPGKFGIYWWENVDTDERRVYYPSQRKNTQREFWELIAEEESAGVLGVPTTYPPKQIDGFVVAGAPDGEEDGFATPDGVERELKETFDYRVTKRHRLKDNKSTTAEEILNLIDLRFEAGKHLLDEYDVPFLQLTTFYLNSLHHYFWDDEVTLRAWKLIDDHLRTFLESEHNLILMSDHGSNEINQVFYINTWLEEQGYLVLDTDVSDTLQRVGMTTDRLIRLTRRLGIRDLAEEIAPQWAINRIPNEEGEFNREQKTDNVDWERTAVLASGQGPIYLTAGKGSPEYESLREQLIEELEGLTTPAGCPVVDAVHRGESVYSGPYTDEAPDLVLDQAKNIHVHGGIGRDEVFVDPGDDGWRAENKRKGLLAAVGPDFSTGGMESPSILDLAPTLLHLHDCPIPRDMDGAVVEELFATGSEPRQREPKYTSPQTRAMEIDRIRKVSRDLSL